MAEEVDDGRQRKGGGRVAGRRVVHEHHRVPEHAAFLLGQPDDPVHPVPGGGTVGFPVFGVDRPGPELHAALLRQAFCRRVVIGVTVRRPERARRHADNSGLLGRGPVHLRGLPGRRKPGHVRVVPGVIADHEAPLNFVAHPLRLGRCVLANVEERGRYPG
jgi:hypothetical protein